MSVQIPVPSNLVHVESNTVEEVLKKKYKATKQACNKRLVEEGYYKSYYAEHKEKYNKKYVKKKEIKAAIKAKDQEEREAYEKELEENIKFNAVQTISFNDNNPTKQLHIDITMNKDFSNLQDVRDRINKYLADVVKSIK